MNLFLEEVNLLTPSLDSIEEFGVGVRYQLNDGLTIGGTYTEIEICSDDSFDAAFVGVSFSF